MKKYKIFYIYLIFALNVIFAQTRCFVNTAVLNIRNAPDIKAKVIGKKYFGDIVNIKTIEGTNVFLNGILDKWCLIESDGGNFWVNYLYLSTFPAKLEYENLFEIKKYNWDYVTNVYDELPERIIIEDIIEEKGVKHFIITIDDSTYYHKDLKNIKVILNPIIKDFLPKSYSDAIRKSRNRTIYMFEESGYFYELGENNEIIHIGWDLPDNAIKINDNQWFSESYLKHGDINELKIQDNITLRKYNFCKNVYEFLKNNMLTSDTILEYGIRLGMLKEHIIELIGIPDTQNDNVFSYVNMSTGYGEIINIEFYLNQIVDITYKIIK